MFIFARLHDPVPIHPVPDAMKGHVVAQICRKLWVRTVHTCLLMFVFARLHDHSWRREQDEWEQDRAVAPRRTRVDMYVHYSTHPQFCTYVAVHIHISCGLSWYISCYVWPFMTFKAAGTHFRDFNRDTALYLEMLMQKTSSSYCSLHFFYFITSFLK